MFDLGWTELLVIGIVSLIVVGPKDLPVLFRKAGQFIGKAKGMAREFSRAMDQAADESGVKDVTKTLNTVTNPIRSSLDGVTEATKSFKNWNPTIEASGLSGDRAAAAEKIHSATAKKAEVRQATEATAGTTVGQSDCGLILIKLQEGFFVAISISLMGGLILSFPYLSFQMWRFVAPGLYKSEKGAFLPFMLASPFMFFLGAGFAFYVVTPLAFNFFLGFQQAGSVLSDEVDNATAGIAFQGSAQEYLSLTIKFIVAFGLCFQLPVLLTLMGKAGLVSSEGLGNVRKYAVVAILVLAALVTPPDVITQVILFVVVYGLYEVSIFLVRRVEKKREDKLRADGFYEDDEDDEDAK
jgi:sec-independent protein translocase protein TatC